MSRRKTQRQGVAAHTGDEPQLSPRDREILKDIVHTYVLSGEPVSSRTLSKHGHGLSAATIRNVMADLEDQGLLRQPHTSAGRVPTESAYRLYVVSLMRMRAVPSRTRRYIDAQLESAAADGDQLMSAASHLLSELSNRVGVVLTPAVEEIVLKSADFVSLGNGRLLCVLVSTHGFVDQVVIEAEEDVARRDLVRISNYVTENYAGQRLRDIRDQLVRAMMEERRGLDDWLRRATALAERAIRDTVDNTQVEQSVLVEGTSMLLDQPELADVERVRRMLDTFADKARLVTMLSRCLESGDGVRVFLGSDSDVTSELDFSLVATSYGTGDSPLGSLGVIGPSRMEYPRMVPLVRYLGETLSRALAEGDK